MTAVADALLDEPTRPLLRTEYDQLVEAGAFEGEKIELLEGRLVVMAPEGPRHASGISELQEPLVVALAGRARVRVGHPLAVSETSEPEPDIAVVALGDYALAHPVTAFMVAEYSHSSLRKDRLVKPALYAAAGVGEYWIVDLVADAITVLADPVGGAYTTSATYHPGDHIALVAFPDVVLAVADLIPRRPPA